MNATHFSPVSLSYTAALRGIKPRHPGDAFTYAVVNCEASDLLIGLAASNPEGQFYVVISNADACAKGTEEARLREVANIHFVRDASSLPRLDYLCCDASEHVLSATDRVALFDLADKKLQPTGLFAYNYPIGADATANLRFLVKEFAPEMNAKQANEFLIELKKLGTLYFKSHADHAAKLNQAIARAMPDEFFAPFEEAAAASAAFDTIVALRPRGFTYAGDSNIKANYVELSVPAEAQALVVECRNNPLYECIKDFALNRTVRHDIWSRQPASTGAEPAELFGSFAYGITLPRDQVPSEKVVEGKTISFDSKLYVTLIDLMTMMPVGVGDVLAHEECKGFAAKDILEAIQILVACEVARPMRGVQNEKQVITSIAQPRLVGSFNQYLDKMPMTGAPYVFASRVLGDVINLPARDALVMQALDRAGLANSVDALLPELQRLAANPAAAAKVMDVAEPTAEVARTMIESVVSQSIVQWYAYGLLEAA